jgi:hypothetical protein
MRWNHWANYDTLERCHFWKVTERVLRTDSTSNLGYWARGSITMNDCYSFLKEFSLVDKIRGSGLFGPPMRQLREWRQPGTFPVRFPDVNRLRAFESVMIAFGRHLNGFKHFVTVHASRSKSSLQVCPNLLFHAHSGIQTRGERQSRRMPFLISFLIARISRRLIHARPLIIIQMIETTTRYTEKKFIGSHRTRKEFGFPQLTRRTEWLRFHQIGVGPKP